MRLLSLLLVLVAPSVAAAGNVYQAGHGSWAGASYPAGDKTTRTDVNVWVDLSVLNLCYVKDVGIRWTDDDWATWHDAAAWYEGSLGSGWERWGVDILPFGGWLWDGGSYRYTTWTGSTRAEPDASVTVQYAVYFGCGGTYWWDANGGANYTLTLTP